MFELKAASLFSQQRREGKGMLMTDGEITDAILACGKRADKLMISLQSN